MSHGTIKLSKYRKIVNKGAKSEELINEIETHKENLYLLDFQTMMQVFYYDWNPWKAIPTGEFDNVLYLAGVTTISRIAIRYYKHMMPNSH